ncbi:MAG: DUF460 domain-containing protein [Thermoprotei archaeon]
MPVYAGLDVNPYEAHSKYSTFSVTILKEDGAKKFFQAVKSIGLASLIKQHHVDVVAFDNLAELAPVLNKLTFELSRIERNVEFVEVAYDESLEAKSQRLGLFSGGKLSPQLASEMVALLASRGQGKKVDLFAPKTVIRIVRRRVPGSGGSSSLRFKRNIETQIKYLKSKIEDKLRAAQLDYDVYARESTGGYSSVSFIIYSDPKSLRGVVYPFVGRDYAVKLERVQARFRYKQPLVSSRPIVVGYDPGITTGVAVLDVSGSLLGVMSARNFDRTEAVSFCSRYGTPVIVATDVSEPPEAVRRLASSFGAKLFLPPDDISVEEKRELVRRFGFQVKTTHERDAAAAAIKAYTFYSKLFDAIKQRTASDGLSAHLLEVIRFVLNGKNIDAALSDVRAKYELQESVQPRPQPSTTGPQPAYVNQLENEISLLRARLVDAESRAARAEERSLELEGKIKAIINEREATLRRDRELMNLEFRVAELTKMLDESQIRLKSLEAVISSLIQAVRRVAEGQAVAVKVIDDLSKSTVEKYLDDPNVKVDLVYVRNPNYWEAEGIMALKKHGILGVIVGGEKPLSPPVFDEYELPVVGGIEAGFQEVPTSGAGLANIEVIKIVRERLRELQQKNKEKKLEALRKLLKNSQFSADTPV